MSGDSWSFSLAIGRFSAGESSEWNHQVRGKGLSPHLSVNVVRVSEQKSQEPPRLRFSSEKSPQNRARLSGRDE
jgi:hypothetical protein